MCYESEAAELVRRLAEASTTGPPLGLLSVSIYDTAWVSMISKVRGGSRHWLFPSSFSRILETQSQQGGWEHGVSDVDGIMNSMAALLAIKWHQKNISYLSCSALPTNLDHRVLCAVGWLNTKLENWDIQNSDQVGFEILIPSLLLLLQQENITFQFPASRHLALLNATKLSKFDPHMLYTSEKNTLLHSLEAFTGLVDFDKISHHIVQGSMMASPSSTAAYLICASRWDDDAEAYLQRAYQHGAGLGTGGFPGAYPTTLFETTWVLSTLLQAGFSVNSLDEHATQQLAWLLERVLKEEGGTLGFAPGILADADDTAKAILTLSIIGRNTNPQKMITEFDTGVHFRTYRGERNSSFSANCNVLHALLHIENPERYRSQILRAAEYICEAWCAGDVKDKWNTSIHYSMMLCSQALVRFLHLWEGSAIPDIPEDITCERIPSALTQILLRTVLAQASDGSWDGGSCEITAYAVLTLISVSTLPWALDSLESYTSGAIEKGKQYLRANHHRWDELKYIWIEKVTYASPILAQAYCLAAMKASPSRHYWSTKTVQLPTESIAKLTRFFNRLPLFSNAPNCDLLVTASLAESYILLPRLIRAIPDIFPRNEKAENRYMEYIPFTWIGCNNLGTHASRSILMDMMVISVLNFQVDQYMEAIVINDSQYGCPTLRKLVTKLCQMEEVTHADHNDNSDKSRNMTNNCQANSTTNGVHKPGLDAFEAIEHVLSRFIKYILAHPAVTHQTRLHMRNTLGTFLHAHLTQLEDNTRFISLKTPPSFPYHDWVHTTSAAHTSCPYSFLFFCCLLRNECFKGVRQKYLAQDLCAHLATMCRMYNDAGSVGRDEEEGNVNSINFSEFDREHGVSEEEAASRDRKRADLLRLAEYERECLERAFTGLEESGVQKRHWRW